MQKLPLTPREFRAIILSHGYFWLAPTIGAETPPSIIIPYNVSGRKGCLRIGVEGKDVMLETLDGSDADALYMANLCLSLDQDIRPMQKIARLDPKWKWLLDEKKGRFLRSPSVFEDCCKAIFTINIQWNRSVQMADASVKKFGSATKARHDGQVIRTFPSAERLAREDVDSLRASLNCGFRAKFILSLCDTALDNPGLFFGDSWREMDSNQFCREIGCVSGMGPMSVAYVSRLYGKTNSYHMDSWVVKRCAKLWGLSEKDVEAHVARRYGEFGAWGPSVFWFELTRYWHYVDGELEEKGL
jgi:3-methyladenine DNA glycosylase/8-oxoguanine DNA glycosylase